MVRKYAIHVIAYVPTSTQSHARGSFPYHISTVRIGDRVWHGSSACHNTDIQMTHLRATMIKRTTKPFAPQWPALNTVAASMITSCNSLGAASAPRKSNPRLPPGKDVKQRAATVPMPRLRIRTALANPSTTRKTTRTPQTAAQAGTASSRCPRTAPSSRANRSRAGSLWRRGATPSRGGGRRTRRSPWTRMSRGRPRRRRRHHRLRPRPSAAASPRRPSSIAWSPRRRRVSRLPGTTGRGTCPYRRLLCLLVVSCSPRICHRRCSVLSFLLRRLLPLLGRILFRCRPRRWSSAYGRRYPHMCKHSVAGACPSCPHHSRQGKRRLPRSQRPPCGCPRSRKASRHSACRRAARDRVARLLCDHGSRASFATMWRAFSPRPPVLPPSTLTYFAVIALSNRFR